MSIIAAYVVPHPPIIIPEVGGGKEKEIEKTTTAYRQIMSQIVKLAPDTVIVLTPHSIMYEDYFHISPEAKAKGDLSKFGCASVQVNVNYDVEFVEKLEDVAYHDNIYAGTQGEREQKLDHGTIIPLYFLEKAGLTCPIVRIGLSGLSPKEHYRLGQCISKVADSLKRKVVVIASGDLSHKLKKDGPYGFVPQGPEFDSQLTIALAKGDFLSLLSFSPKMIQAVAECGLKSFQIMAGTLDKKAITHELLSYQDTFGVGYAVASFIVKGEDETRNFLQQFEMIQTDRLRKLKAEESQYVRLARLSLETYTRTGELAIIPSNLPKDLTEKRAGVFVSLKINGILRGCIGTISPTTNSIAEEIHRNAVSAGVTDPRFDVVTEEELDEIIYSVDVLGETEKIASSQELDVKRYGVIVESGIRRGLLLPNLEDIDTIEEQISIAKQKAGIGEHEKVSLSRFEVVRFR